MTVCSIEDALLIYCGIVHPSDSIKLKAQKILRTCSSSLDWNYLLEKADSNDVVPQFYYNLCSLTTDLKDDTPNHAKEELRRMFIYSFAHNVTLLNELKGILKAFGTVGITTLPLKGVVLLETAYPGPHLRTMRDIDLLVPDRHTAERAGNELSKLGFIRHSANGIPKEFFRYRGGRIVPIDLHHIIGGWARGLATLEYLETSGIWKRSVRGKIFGMRVRIMSSEDMFLVLCAHVLAHARITLRDLSDAVAILRLRKDCFDWNYVVNTAVASDLHVPLYCVLYLLEKFYEEKVMSWVVKASLEGKPIVKLFKSILKTTWSVQNGTVASFLILYKQFFKIKKMGAIQSIKYYRSFAESLLKDYVFKKMRARAFSSSNPNKKRR